MLAVIRSLALLGTCGITAACDAAGSRADAQTSTDACVLADGERPLWVSTSNYSSGAIVAFAPRSQCALPPTVVATGDTLIAAHGSRLIALKYQLGSVDELAQYARDGVGLSLIGAVSPRLDMGSANARAYVALSGDWGLFSRNDQSSLGVYSLSQNAVVRNVELSDFRASARHARPYAIAMNASRVFVTLQRIPTDFDRWPNGAVVALDRSTLAVLDADPQQPGTQAIELERGNPFGAISLMNDTIYVPCAGALRNLTDGAIARVHAQTLTVIDYLGNESILRGNPLHVLALSPDRLLLVTMTEPSPDDQLSVAQTRLVEYSVSENRTTKVWLEVPEYSLTAPVRDSDGRVYIGDRGSETLRRPSGVIGFLSDGTRVSENPVRVGLPPYQLLAE